MVRLKGPPSDPPLRRVNHRRILSEPVENHVRKNPDEVRRHGRSLEICVCDGCTLGPIEKQATLAVVRYTVGYLTYRKFGSFFEEALRFPDGKKHKYTHGICAYDHGLRIAELNMEYCLLPRCGEQFYCGRDDRQEGCLLLEQGYFQARKGGLYVQFVPEQRGCVHWACARAVWQQHLLTPAFSGGLIDGRTP